MPESIAGREPLASPRAPYACSRKNVFSLSFLALLWCLPTVGAEVELLRMGEYRISMLEGECGDEVDLIIRARRWEAFEEDAEIRQASRYAEYDVTQSGCEGFQAFRIRGLVDDVLVYEGVTTRASGWTPVGSMVAAGDRTPTQPPPAGMYGPVGNGGTPAREYLNLMAGVEAPSMDLGRCGPFELLDPFGSGQATTLEAAITKLAAGNLDAHFVNGGRYGEILDNIRTQRTNYDQRCMAAILLDREQLCSESDFDCAVTMSCTRYSMPGISEESKALFPSCIDSATRQVAEQRQRTLAATIHVDGIRTELIVAKLPGADENLGEWCGESLHATINWPQGYNLTPSLARTVSDILNQSLNDACPSASNLTVSARRFKSFGNRRQHYGSEPFLRAYREAGVWNIAYHDDFLQQQRASATVESLFSTMKAIGSNPTTLGFAAAAAPLNAAMAAQQRSRFATYAREGKVCRMRDPVRHCYVSTTYDTGYGGRIGRTMIISSTPRQWSSCAAPCEFHRGYCNMDTGARYPDAESAERANCRTASQAEIDAAIAAANVNENFPPYDHDVLYLPWDRIPE